MIEIKKALFQARPIWPNKSWQQCYILRSFTLKSGGSYFYGFSTKNISQVLRACTASPKARQKTLTLEVPSLVYSL